MPRRLSRLSGIAVGLTALGLAASVHASAAADPVSDFFKRFRTAPEPGVHVIRPDFTPEREDLTPITGEDLETLFDGKSIAGIYFQGPSFDDQRFVEHFPEMGETVYIEGKVTSVGTYRVGGDVICFHYSEIEGAEAIEFCHRNFRYGDCIISYPANAVFHEGLPKYPQFWGSVSRFVDPEFTWPDAAPSEQDAFRCRLDLV